MEGESHKRKSSQEISNDTSNTKYPKTNAHNMMNNNRIATQRNTIIEKIVSVWKTGSDNSSLATQEGRDIVKLQEYETKYMEANKVIHSMKKKLILSEENIVELNILLKKEHGEKHNLLNKISSIGELIGNISQHITCITESLERFQVQINDLSDKYNNVILKLRADNEEKKIAVKEIHLQLNEKKKEFDELNVKYKTLEYQIVEEKEKNCKTLDEMNDNKKKLMEMEIVNENMKSSMLELEKLIHGERCKLEDINAINEKKYEKICNDYEVKIIKLNEKFENTEKQLQQSEQNQIELSKSLQEKTELIENQQREVLTYQTQARQLMCQVTDIGVNLEDIKNKKTELEVKLEIICTELSQSQRELETVTIEKDTHAKEIVRLNEILRKEAKERMELSADLTQSKIKLQETVHENNNMNKRLAECEENKECDAKNLQRQIEKLKKKLDQALMKNDTEIRTHNELEQKYERDIKIQREKYEKCLADLDKLSKNQVLMRDESSKFLLSTAAVEREKLEKKFLIEKKLIEDKLNKSEELLIEKTDREKELIEKLKILETELATLTEKYKDSEKTKDDKIIVLEKKLSNLELPVISKAMPVAQPRRSTLKGSKNIHVKKDEILTTSRIKSILKPHLNSYSPKSPIKSSPRKISFAYHSDHTEENHDINRQHSTSSYYDQFDELIKTSQSPMAQETISQSVKQPSTPRANKFFKSRSNQ